MPGPESRPRASRGDGPGGSAPTSPIPVVEAIAVRIDPAERRDLARRAEALLRTDPALSARTPFGSGVSAGLRPGPSLLIEDHSWIRLFEHSGDLMYSYRALLLANAGDLVVIGVPRNPVFEAYCRETLGLGRVGVLSPAAGKPTDSLGARCTNDPQFIEQVADRARGAAGLSIIPYMGTADIWRLAGAIAARADVPIRVAAPPARLTRLANDKIWFTQRVAELFGRSAIPAAEAAYSVSDLTRQTRRLAERFASVAIKLPDSASAAGNIVLDPAESRGVTPRVLHDRLLASLLRIGWNGRFPLMVTAWESPLLSSPSVHLWIPETAAGGPIVEGIFDQTTLGKAREFSGAAPTALPRSWQRRLAEEAVRLGCLFQDLGYFGRCSFDAILVGDEPAKAALHWIECNGRWGGVSIPLTLANRLRGGAARRKPFVIIEEAHLSGPGQQLGAFLEAMRADDLYVRDRRATGIVMLSPTRIEDGSGFELMVIDETPEKARDRAAELAARLTAGRTAR